MDRRSPRAVQWEIRHQPDTDARTPYGVRGASRSVFWRSRSRSNLGRSGSSRSSSKTRSFIDFLAPKPSKAPNLDRSWIRAVFFLDLGNLDRVLNIGGPS